VTARNSDLAHTGDLDHRSSSAEALAASSRRVTSKLDCRVRLRLEQHLTPGPESAWPPPPIYDRCSHTMILQPHHCWQEFSRPPQQGRGLWQPWEIPRLPDLIARGDAPRLSPRGSKSPWGHERAKARPDGRVFLRWRLWCVRAGIRLKSGSPISSACSATCSLSRACSGAAGLRRSRDRSRPRACLLVSPPGYAPEPAPFTDGPCR